MHQYPACPPGHKVNLVGRDLQYIRRQQLDTQRNSLLADFELHCAL